MREYYRGHSVYFETKEEAERFQQLYPELFTNPLGFWIGMYRTNIARPNKYLWHVVFQCKKGMFDDIKSKLALKRRDLGKDCDGRVKTGWCFVKEVRKNG